MNTVYIYLIMLSCELCADVVNQFFSLFLMQQNGAVAIFSPEVTLTVSPQIPRVPDPDDFILKSH